VEIFMIKLNLPVLFAQKGIRVADADRLTDMGRTTLYRLYNNEVTRIDFASLERLCKLLDCTPGDIILYEDDGQTDSQKKEPTN
jgi:putative transcriptional regulator